MKLRLVSILGALALTASVAAAPAAAAGTGGAPSEPVTASVLTPAQLGPSGPAQFTDYPWGAMTWGGAAFNNAAAPGWGAYLSPMSMTTPATLPTWSSPSVSRDSDSDSSSDNSCSCMRRQHHWWGGSPTTPWWAGMPLSQISAMTGGTWPWAFGPPLFAPPPPPPLIPLGFGGGFGNNNLIRLSANAVIPGRLSAQALVGTGLGLGFGGAGFGGFGGGFGAPNIFNVNGGVNGIGVLR